MTTVKIATEQSSVCLVPGSEVNIRCHNFTAIIIEEIKGADASEDFQEGFVMPAVLVGFCRYLDYSVVFTKMGVTIQKDQADRCYHFKEIALRSTMAIENRKVTVFGRDYGLLGGLLVFFDEHLRLLVVDLFGLLESGAEAEREMNSYVQKLGFVSGTNQQLAIETSEQYLYSLEVADLLLVRYSFSKTKPKVEVKQSLKPALEKQGLKCATLFTLKSMCSGVLLAGSSSDKSVSVSVLLSLDQQLAVRSSLLIPNLHVDHEALVYLLCIRKQSYSIVIPLSSHQQSCIRLVLLMNHSLSLISAFPFDTDTKPAYYFLASTKLGKMKTQYDLLAKPSKRTAPEKAIRLIV